MAAMKNQILPPSNSLLTKKQAAEYLGIAPRTLDDWRKAQAIACIERPGFVRFIPSDLDDFLARHRKVAKAVSKFRPRLKRKSETLPPQVH